MKINMAAFDNVLKGDYKEMSEAWDKAIGPLEKRSWGTYGGDEYGEWAVFSMYDRDEDEDFCLFYPDFESNPLVCEGDLEVYIQDWDEASTVLTNPRINDVFRFFANNHDGHHGFLECIEESDGKLILHAGS